MLDLNVRRLGHISIIEAGGRIDGMTAGMLMDALTDEINGRGARIILDLAKVDYLSGAGLKVLKDLNDKTGDVRLSRPSDAGARGAGNHRSWMLRLRPMKTV